MEFDLRRLRGVLAWLARASVVPVVLVGAPLLAQQIDPSILSRVQGSLGSSMTGGTSASDRLDASRERGDQQLQDTVTTPGATAEELELRRQQSRRALQRFYTPSAIEREYRERTGDPNLRQFGYDLFRSTEGSGGGQVTGEVGNSYILGVGDEIVVAFQGATNDSRTARVDREGRLVVGQLRPIRAAGRSLGAVRSDVAAETRRTLLGTEVYLSLGSVRAISVFVGGEVERPGQYRLTSLADVANALARAGGVRGNGSLRKIRVNRGGASLTVDLYGLLGIGAPSQVRLQDGDRIIVPVIGDTAAITGSVARPAIYELRGPVSVSNFVDYAGGAIRPRGNKIAISRIAADGTESFVRGAGNATGVMPGDAVQVVGGSAGGTAGRVMLRGYVQNPGPRPLVAAATIRDLLGEPTDLRTGTYLPMAILLRRDPLTSARVFQPVNLITALRDGGSVPLRSDDLLYVFSQRDIEFMNSQAVRRIVLGQPNPEPQCRALERLEQVVADTQSSRFAGLTRGTFVIRRNGRNDIDTASLAARDRGLRANQAEDRATTAVGASTQRPVSVATARTTSDVQRLTGTRSQDTDNLSDEDLRRLDDLRRERERREARVQLGGASATDELCPTVFEDEPELLPVLIENAVGVGGAVHRPGAYPVAGTVTAEMMVAVAQGAASNTTDNFLDVTRSTSTAATTERFAIDPARTALAKVTLRAGDDLRFNAGQPQIESGAVLLAGEFQRPGLYTFRKGETLSQLMARAGGLTPQAYTYGSIYTRASVKELQEEGLRRTARELNAGLLAAQARKTGDTGSSLTGAIQLVRELTDMEVPGRMVVESDPTVLSVRPELDTVLEPGDAIYIPKRPNFVLALGDVNNPTALQFVAEKRATDYLREAGGYSQSADRDRVFIVLPNGTAQPLKSGRGSVVPPGSTIIVPKNVDPTRTLDFIRNITSIFAQVATSVATLAILATR